MEKKKKKRLARQKNWNDRRQREKDYLLLQEQNDFQRVEGKQAIKRGKIKEKSSAWADVYRELKLGYTAVPWRAIVST